EAFDLTVRFAAVPVLEGAYFRALPAELTTVEGPSGSGKSSLLHVLAGHARPARGAIRVAERHRVALADRRRLHRRASRVFQSGNLIETATVRENIALRVTLGDLRPRCFDRAALD